MSRRPISARIQGFFAELGQTVMSLLKMVLQSRPTERPARVTDASELVVLGNGPSLRGLIEEQGAFLKGKALLAVNYAVLSDYYVRLQPEYYLVADPAFFCEAAHCDRLFDNLAARTTWPMHLYLSAGARRSRLWQSKLAGNTHIRVHYFNMTPVEGFRWFTHLAFSRGWGMPRPRNVLIPALMTALRMPFETIYVAGADHSWLKEIWVNEENVVMEDLNHFYDKKGSERYVSSKHLHDLLLSMHIAFKSYHIIRAYADSRGRKIYNVTKGSYIDAFERKRMEGRGTGV